MSQPKFKLSMTMDNRIQQKCRALAFGIAVSTSNKGPRRSFLHDNRMRVAIRPKTAARRRKNGCYIPNADSSAVDRELRQKDNKEGERERRRGRKLCTLYDLCCAALREKGSEGGALLLYTTGISRTYRPLPQLFCKQVGCALQGFWF